MQQKKALLIRKKRSFSLLEIIIATALFTTILTFLFGFFQQFTKVYAWKKKQQYSADEKNLGYARLKYIFSHIREDAPKNLFFLDQTDQNNPVFFFTFENGLNYNPAFSGTVLGKLYLEKHIFKLTIWNIPERNSQGDTVVESPQYFKEEPIFSSVSSVRFRFLPTQKNSDQKDSSDWTTKWELEQKEAPMILEIQLEFEQNSSPVLFKFPLLQMKKPIPYTVQEVENK